MEEEQKREKLGLPPTKEDPPSVFSEKDKLEKLQTEQKALEKQKKELISKQEKERLIREEKEKNNYSFYKHASRLACLCSITLLNFFAVNL